MTFTPNQCFSVLVLEGVCLVDVSLPHHACSEWMGHYEASAELDGEPIIRLRCVEVGKHLKHAEYEPPRPGLKNTTPKYKSPFN